MAGLGRSLGLRLIPEMSISSWEYKTSCGKRWPQGVGCNVPGVRDCGSCAKHRPLSPLFLVRLSAFRPISSIVGCEAPTRGHYFLEVQETAWKCLMALGTRFA